MPPSALDQLSKGITSLVYIVFIKNCIIGYCISRVFIGLAIMGYEPLYHALQIWYANAFWGIFIFSLVYNCLYFGGIFNKTIIPFALVGYEIGYSQLMSNARSWNDC